MTKLDLLVTGRAMLANEYNWCKGVGTRPGPDGGRQYCARGAISEQLSTHDAKPMSKEHIRLHAATIDALEDELPDYYANVQDFNDNRRTTHVDILALYDRAIAKQRSKQIPRPTGIEVFEKLLETKELVD